MTEYKKWLIENRAVTASGRHSQNHVCLNIVGTSRSDELMVDWFDRINENWMNSEEERMYVNYYKESLNAYTKKEQYPFKEGISYKDDIYECMSVLEHMIIQDSINMDKCVKYGSKELDNIGALVILLQNLQDKDRKGRNVK